MPAKNLFTYAEPIHELRAAKTFDYQDMAAKLRAKGKDIISFGIGQPDFPTPPHIVEAGVQALRNGFTRYVSPPGIPELRQAIAQFASEFTGAADILPSEVLVTAGAKHAMFFAMASCIRPGDEVIIADPSFYSYAHVTRYAGGIPVFLPVHEDQGFTFTFEELQAHVTPKTRMIVLNSPHNPTGGMLAKATLQATLELAKDRGILVISDEIYDHYLYDQGFMSVLEDPDWREFVIYVNSFSKTYAMAGWRLGYLIACEPAIKRFSLVTANTVSCTTAFVQKAGVTALMESQAFFDDILAQYRARRAYLYDALTRIPGLHTENPAGAFYFFPNISQIIEDSGRSTEEIAITLMEEAGIVVLPGSAFPNTGGEGYLRLSYALPLPTIKTGIERLKTGLAEIRQ
ncbi:MAG: pyridoxal phosphate-dependent aminotransferase [Candidatus Bathyarchaeota archaeon]|nr:pyridoxal phosphate-dependent aminotransferase [Candidatus Bathyarchaeota archaeon]